MADKKTAATLPWGMSKETLQPNSVKTISQSKIKAFNVGRMNPPKKPSPFIKKKEEKEVKKKLEAKQTAEVFEEFIASFEDTGSSGKTFVRGSSSIKPSAVGDEAIPNPKSGLVYKPKSKIIQKLEEKSRKEKNVERVFSASIPASTKPAKKKGAEKKKSILELFREELKRSQDSRNERKAVREAGVEVKVEKTPPPQEEPEEVFDIEDYKDMTGKGSFDNGDPLTTNLYVGNINPKMNEENLCQLFGKFGPLASVKVMWPRTEEEKARNKNCGFVAYMERADAEKALENFKGTTIMDYEVQIGWGKSVRVPPQPVYVAPDKKKDEEAKTLDPPSGLPFNAQAKIGAKKDDGDKDQDAAQNFDDALYNAVIKVVIPTDIALLKVIHRMIEFVVREGPMFEAMIMTREISNSMFQFLFDNRSPAHVYYRWKLFSILQGDSPETWKVEEFRMFDGGSLWKPPPLKNLRSKVLPPLDQHITRRGQLSTRQRDEFEDQLRNLTMDREKIKKSMVWCLDHSDSAEEIVECMCEALCIDETPLPTKIARLYLVSDILLNCSSSVPSSSNFRRGLEGKLLSIIEHFHAVMTCIMSRIRAEQFKRRILSCLRAWDQMSVYHYNVVDKFRLTFIGRSTEESEKKKAFDTVAALIGIGGDEVSTGEIENRDEYLDGVPIFDNRPIDFSGGVGLDGEPMENIDGESYPDPNIDGEPIGKDDDDLDGIPFDAESKPAVEVPVKSKWELVDYGDDSDSDNEDTNKPSTAGESMSDKERKQLMAEVDERKRKILREVEVKAMELYDALESNGSYSKDEIAKRMDKYRDKLMQEAVEPKFSPSPSNKSRVRSRSPSPSTLDKYRLDDSPPRRGRSISPRNTVSISPVARRQSRSQSPVSPVRRRRSRSKSPVVRSKKHLRSSSRSPKRKRSKSPRSRSPKKRRSRSRSPAKSSSRRRSKSPRHSRRKSRSRSPSSKTVKKSKKRSRSRSPHKRSKKSKH